MFGIYINIVAFAATSQNTESLVLFIIILIFVSTTFLITCIYICINVKTKYYCRLKTELNTFVEPLIKKGMLINFFQSELIVLYKHHELVFDILLFVYGFAISNWSPEKKNILCIIVLVVSSFDLLWNLVFTCIHIKKITNLKENSYSSY